MIVIAYYTIDTPYEREAESFIQNMKEYGVHHKVYPIESKGSWVFNCGAKPKIILDALNEFDENILYTDIDSRFVRKPPFHEIEKDIPGYIVWHPAFRPEGQLASGTIYIPNNDLGRKVLDAWVDEQNKDLTVWDQDTLFKVYKRFDWVEPSAFLPFHVFSLF